MKGAATLIRKKKEILYYWQGMARLETRWLSETIKKCDKLEKEIRELEKQKMEKK